MYTSQAGTLLQGDWRHRLASGGYRVELAGVWNDGTFKSPVDGDFRGSIITQGKFALNPYWAWGWDGEAETDDTFRRYYNLDDKLKTDQISELYLEGLHDRNYLSTRFFQTGTLLTTKDPLADATVLPIIDYDYIVNHPIIGGELSFNSNVMALQSRRHRLEPAYRGGQLAPAIDRPDRRGVHALRADARRFVRHQRVRRSLDRS